MTHATDEGAIGSGTIVVDRLTKKFGSLTAVDDLSFTVAPGRVTGFLGPNGAGKTTTLRMLLGLVRPTSGTATIGGERYAELPQPQRVVGAALEAAVFHPGRTRSQPPARAGRRPASTSRRVDEVLEMVGLADAAAGAPGGYSMGMRQRLGAGRGPAGRPAGAAARRAGQRARPGGDRAGCAASCDTSPARAARSWSPATCCRRSSRPSTTS